LLSWRRFEHQGQDCEVLAKSPKRKKAHGLNLHIHVRLCGEDSVDYSTLIARITSENSTKTPERIKAEGASQFPALLEALDAERLVSEGQFYLYDNDIRKMLDALLEPYTYSVWPGVSLVCQEAGFALAAQLENVFSTALCNGSLSVSLIALEMSQANRQALARELTQELQTQLHKLTERCSYTAPNSKAITADYEALAEKISQAEHVLGVPLPLIEAQIQTESAIMALA